MINILFISNYPKDNQHSMKRYADTHAKILKTNKDINIEHFPIKDIIFNNKNNKFFRFFNKYIFFSIYIFFKSLRYDLIHISDQGNAFLKLFIFKKTVITCHDLILYKKKKNSFKEKLYSNLNLIGMKLADQIIAVSKNTKKDLYKILKKKINYIYTPVFEKKVKLSNFSNTKKYLLHIGSIYYKNRMMAFKILKKLISLNYNYYLNCIGKLNYDEKKFLLNENLLKRVKLYNNIRNVKKKRIFQSSRCLIVTSIYEGYGFPILEAYSLKVPVVSSNKGSLKEICTPFSMVKKYNVLNYVKKILIIDKNIFLRNKIIKKNTIILRKINNVKNYKLFYKNIYTNILR